MNPKPLALALALATTALSLQQAAAHHSFSMFDASKVVTLQGTVKEFEWVNPHTWLHIMVTDNTGVPKLWSLEMNSTALQASVGWKSDSLTPGDKVTVEMNPLKDGTRGGAARWVTLPDGRKLGRAGGRNEPGAGTR
jgi:hypothetical protein